MQYQSHPGVVSSDKKLKLNALCEVASQSCINQCTVEMASVEVPVALKTEAVQAFTTHGPASVVNEVHAVEMASVAVPVAITAKGVQAQATILKTSCENEQHNRTHGGRLHTKGFLVTCIHKTKTAQQIRNEFNYRKRKQVCQPRTVIHHVPRRF
jgi:hypothetical protein